MTVQSDPATMGEKEIKTEYPVTEGLTSGTTRLKEKNFKLEPEQSFIPEVDKIGL